MFLGHLHNLVGVAVADKVSFFDAVEERVANVPADPVVYRQSPGEGRLVEVDEKTDGEVAQLDIFKVEAGAGGGEEGGEAREEEGEVAEARDGGDERVGGVGGVGDV